MELADSKKEGFAINTSVEIEIESFRTDKERIITSPSKINACNDFEITFSVSVFPDGVNQETKGWLTVVPDVEENNGFIILDKTVLSLIVSMIDIDGHSRLPQSFEMDYVDGITPDDPFYIEDYPAKYLERSFILSRADEFLPEDVLTLRCEIFLTWSGVSPGVPMAKFRITEWPLRDFFNSIPRRVCFKNDVETGDPIDAFIVYDLTSQIITSTEFHKLIMEFGCFFRHAELFSTESKEDGTDISEHVWIFDARPDRFLLSLDERQDTVEARLLKASSLIRECVNAPLKGQQENRIEFSNVDSETFEVVLLFLATGAIPILEFGKLVDVYKFSHLYGMEELQRRCAEVMVEKVKPESYLEKVLEGNAYTYSDEFMTPEEIQSYFEKNMRDIQELERIADLFWDEYLSELLESRRHEYLESDVLYLRMDDTPYSDCYI